MVSYLKINPEFHGIIVSNSPEDYIRFNSNILPIQLIYNNLEYKNNLFYLCFKEPNLLNLLITIKLGFLKNRIL